MRALLIGAGNIGFRHFQSLAKFPFKEVLVVEANSSRLASLPELCKKETPIAEIRFYSSLAEAVRQDGSIDLAVSAVTADRQLEVARELANLAIRHLILEKPVAQSLAQVEALAGLLPAAYVNTPRSFWAGYRFLHAELQKLGPAVSRARLTISGNRWGLGCNGLHFISLARYLLTLPNAKVSSSEIRPQSGGSKRGENFEEYCGNFSIEDARSNHVSISCDDDQASKVAVDTIRLEVAGNEFTIDEAGNAGVQRKGETLSPMGAQFVSESTLRFAETVLLGKGNYQLPTLVESISDHQLLFTALEKSTGRREFRIT